MALVTRTCFVHIGTHKTGSTALQFFLDENRTAFDEAGLGVLRTGRDSLHWLNHDLAWELIAGKNMVQLRALEQELRGLSSAHAILTSEDFSLLHDRPDAIERLTSAIRRTGFRPVIIVYLRDQASYADSMYGQRFRSGEPIAPFPAFIRAILDTGTFQLENGGAVEFDYERLLAPFEALVGMTDVAVRAYALPAHPGHIYRDFLGTLVSFEPGLPLASIPLNVTYATVNERLPFAAVLGTMHNRLLPHVPLPEDPADFLRMHAPELPPEVGFGAYALLTYEESVAILERFAAPNARVAQRYGVALPFVNPHEMVRSDDPRCALARIERPIYDRCYDAWARQRDAGQPPRE